MSHYTISLGFLFVFALASPAAADVCDKAARKADGKVVLEAVKNPQGLRGVRACVYMDSTTEQVYATLIDYPSFPKWMDKVDTIKAKWVDERVALVDYEVGTLFGTWRYQLHREHDKNLHIQWHRTTGDMKVVLGEYFFIPVTGATGSLFVIETYVDPGYSVPSFVESYFKEKGTRQLLEDIRDETRKRNRKK